MSVRVIVVRREKDVIQVFPASLVGERGEKKLVVTREKDIIQVFPASLVGERGEKKLVVTSDGATREYLKDEVFGTSGLAERRIDELLESM